jgi:hypothetical protein
VGPLLFRVGGSATARSLRSYRRPTLDFLFLFRAVSPQLSSRTTHTTSVLLRSPRGRLGNRFPPFRICLQRSRPQASLPFSLRFEGRIPSSNKSRSPHPLPRPQNHSKLSVFGGLFEGLSAVVEVSGGGGRRPPEDGFLSDRTWPGLVKTEAKVYRHGLAARDWRHASAA